MSHIHLAHETIRRIEESVRADQGSTYRGWLGKVLPHINDAYRTDEDGHRSHLGASIVGQECPRAIWYNFRWAWRSNFSGRMIRLFNRGHLEEGRMIAALLSIGCQVVQQDEQGKQFRVSWADGHAGGSGDGVTIGLPDLPAGTPALIEFKTHNNKSFEKLAGANWNKYVEHLLDPGKPAVQFDGEGVRESKFEHYVQANIYMRKMGLAVCLYGSVNKDNDAIYMELIPLDVKVADEFMDRGEKLVYMDQPPAKISGSIGFWKCKFCDFNQTCHLKKEPDRNCRTCAYSAPLTDGSWKCQLKECTLDKSAQLAGCEHYCLRKAF